MLKESSDKNGGVIYVPSPVQVLHNFIYTIEVNKSGHLQHYLQPVNRKRKRITKTEFSRIYNTIRILAINPVRDTRPDANHYLLKFYTI
jgi:hypothetical protein